MGHAPNSTAIAGDTWTLLKAFASELPKSVAVKSDAASANTAEIFVTPMHGASSPIAESGYPLAAGEEHVFTDLHARGGDGLITAVYGKSTGATIHVAVDVR